MLTEKQINKLKNREFRHMTMTARTSTKEDDESYIVEGYATTFNQPYTLYEGRYYKVEEQISSTAFDECDMQDVIMQYDHEGRVYARNKNKTLELSVDNKGLFIRANLGGTDEGKKLYQEIKGGYTDKMSFAFVVAEDERVYKEDLENDFETCIRTITKISKIYDVSAVSIPANDMTSISARNFSDGVIAEIETERLKRAKKKLELKIKLMEE